MSKRLEIYKSLVEKDQIYNIGKFDSVFSIDESFIFTIFFSISPFTIEFIRD
jgi:hypothetical protein